MELLKGTSPSTISWIGSVQTFCFMTIAVIMGPIFDMGYCRPLIIVGALLEIVGFMLTSISTKFWQILLAQGICVGLGTCCLSIPSMAIVPLYFSKRRALAMATATVGSGIGAALYPLMFQRLQRQIGFGWTMRIIGFLSFTMCLFAFAVLKPKKNPEKPTWQLGGISWRWFIDLSAFKERSFLMFCAAAFFNNLAFFNQSYYLQGYALTHGMAGMQLTAYLLSIMNFSTIPGRLIPSYIADKVGTLDTYTVVVTLSSATIFYWISVVNTAGNIAFAVMWGLFSGGVVALSNVVLTGITPDLSRLGTRLGMVSILKGLGSLIGPPISGAILDATGGYLGVQLFSAASMLTCGFLMLLLRLMLARQALGEQRADGSNDRRAGIFKAEAVDSST